MLVLKNSYQVSEAICYFNRKSIQTSIPNNNVSLGIQGISEIGSELLDSKLSHTVGNMMNEILFGIHYEENDKNWIKIQKLREAGIKEIQVATPVNFLPWLRHLGGLHVL